MRSSFEVLKEKMPRSATLGLSIGIELGPLTLSRVGVQGNRHRCAVGRAVITAEQLQQRSTGTQTRIGPEALAHAPPSIRDAFQNGVCEGLAFGKVIALLKDADEPVARFGVEPVASAQITYPRAHTR
jgi:class 3 adenylate cyclase